MCDCINMVNDKLKESNTRLGLSLSFTGGPNRVLLHTEKIDTKKRDRPMALCAVFCPFCGERIGESAPPESA